MGKTNGKPKAKAVTQLDEILEKLNVLISESANNTGKINFLYLVSSIDGGINKVAMYDSLREKAIADQAAKEAVVKLKTK